MTIYSNLKITSNENKSILFNNIKNNTHYKRR